MTTTRLIALAAALAAAIACGGNGDNDSPTAPSPPTGGGGGGGATQGTTITIGANGVVSPNSLTVPVGTRVTFTNSDSRPHDMSSDPHPDHTDCPEINQAGFVQPGQSRQTGNLNTVRTCGFHDHNDPTNPNLTGTIRIQ
jgi:plastocyanin